MHISLFASKHNPKVSDKNLTWDEILLAFHEFSIREDKDGVLYSFTKYSTPHRADENVAGISAIVLDFDKGGVRPDDFDLEKFRCLWHSTFQHTDDEPRWRLIIPLTREVNAEEYYHCFDVVCRALDAFSGLDTSCRSVSRAYYAPSCPKNRETLKFVGHSDGKITDADKLLSIAIEPIKKTEKHVIGRNNTLVEICSAMVSRGEYFDTIIDELVSFDSANHSPPLFTDTKEGYKGTARDGAIKFANNIHRSLKQKPTHRLVSPPPILTMREKPVELPDFIFNPPGLVGETYRWILATAIKPQKEIALAAALCAVGTVMGRKVRTPTNLRTNVYFISLIESGAGKDWPRHAVMSIFEKMGKPKRAYVEELASDTAIIEALDGDWQSQVFLLDEIGKVIQATKNAKAHLAGIPTMLMRLFSSAASSFSGRVYASRKNNRSIMQPNLSLLGTSTPETFFRSLTQEATTDGFLNRFVILPSNDPDPIARRPTNFEPPESLLAQYKAWEAKSYGRGVFASMPQNAPDPTIIPINDEAQAYIEAKEKDLRELRASLRADNLAATYTRVMDIAQRIALILSAPGPITRPAMEYGYTLAKFSADYALKIARSHISDNQTESNLKRVQNILERHRTLTMQKLYLQTRWLTKAQRQDILFSLEATGEVVITQTISDGRPVKTISYQPLHP